MNSEYKKYLSSKTWKDKRKRIIKDRGCKCNKCGSNKSLQLHHKTYVRIFNEKDSDLEVLCAKCHMKEHGITHTKKRIPMNSFVRYKTNGNINLKGTRVPSGRFAGSRMCYMKKQKHIDYMVKYVINENNPKEWVEVMKLQLKILGYYF